MTSRAGQFFTETAPLSPELEAAVQESMRRSERLYAQLPTTYPGSLRIEYATRWLMLSLDHRESFLLLVHMNRRSSAYALMRSIYEAWSRGFWAVGVATDDQIEAITTRRKIPKMDTVAKDLNRHLDAAITAEATVANPELQRGAYAHTKAVEWGSLCDFAHGGLQQLARWTDAEGIVAPAHTDEEAIWRLRKIDVWGVITCSALFAAARAEIPQAVLDVHQELAAMRQPLPTEDKP